LIDDYVIFDGIAFGGLASGLVKDNGKPDTDFLSRFASLDEPKVLISHHPEYYVKYIKELPIDLVVSGHAHGGQWRIFGRGVFAPGQGIFPKYTSGVIDNRCVISRGVGDHTVIPRIANPRELIIIHCGTKTENQ
jgi:predicted MPP superfamily phosphohydrolase